MQSDLIVFVKVLHCIAMHVTVMQQAKIEQVCNPISEVDGSSDVMFDSAGKVHCSW